MSHICRLAALLWTVSVSTGPDSSAQITLANGKQTTVHKERGQAGIAEAKVAPNGSVGWLVNYPVPWTFYAQGKQVAYHVGPLHGESKSHCELHDVDTGRRLAAWDGNLGSASGRPAWTSGLTH